MKFLTLLFLGIYLCLGQVNLVMAEDASNSATESTASAANSFELFWPLTAGKTMDDTLYFLKTWKENLRGLLIFGNFQKAEYNTLLSTKRLLEATELSNNGKTDLANKTLELSVERVKLAESEFQSVQKNRIPASVSDIKNRLSGMSRFIQDSTLNGGKLPDKSHDLLKQVNQLNSEI